MFARALVVSLLMLVVPLFIVSCGGDGGGRSAKAEPSNAPPAEELRAEVMELEEFHQVIFELWHNAWPSKDYEQMRQLLPEVHKHVAILEKVELPGILRDKKGEWDEGIVNLRNSTTAYEKAVANDDEEGLLDAVEQLHSDFEHLARLVRPIMREMDAYHVELYQIYHYYLPNRNLEELRATTEQMSVKCTALAEAKPPRWFEGDPASLEAAAEDLCTATLQLKEVAQGKDWTAIEAAVEAVHDRYLAVMGLFE